MNKTRKILGFTVWALASFWLFVCGVSIIMPEPPFGWSEFHWWVPFAILGAFMIMIVIFLITAFLGFLTALPIFGIERVLLYMKYDLKRKIR